MTRPTHRQWAAIFAVLCAFLPQGAMAAASQWNETDGGRLRIVVEAPKLGQSELRGMLQIELAPGWKTYWREPGAAGIPPQISVTEIGIAGVTLHYPAPHWSDDAYGSWAGYKHPVELPLTFTLTTDKPPETISADVFLGICKDICVPVSAHFDVTLTDRRGAMMQSLLIDAAFDALPGGNSDRLAIDSAAWTADGKLEIKLRHAAAGEDDPQLFLSAGANHPFRKPVRVAGDDTTTVFRAEPAFEPAGGLQLTATARNGIDTVEVPLTVAAP